MVCLYGSVFSGVGDTGLSDEHQVCSRLWQAGSWLRSDKAAVQRPQCEVITSQWLQTRLWPERESVRECERETETEIKEIKRDKDMVTKRQRSRKKAEAR